MTASKVISVFFFGTLSAQIPGLMSTVGSDDGDWRGRARINDIVSSPLTDTLLAGDKVEAKVEPFFDTASSSSTKGRYRVNDARDFDAKTLRFEKHATDFGVSFLLGTKTKNVWASVGKELKRETADVGEEEAVNGIEQVVTVLFDRSIFSEDQARSWWERNQLDFRN